MHETDPEGRRRVEALARDEVAPGRARADLRQREGGDDGGDDPELDLREGEHGALVRDRDVRAGDEAGTAAECVPPDARHDRRGAAVDGLEHAAQRVRVGHVRVVVEVDGGAHPLDVGAGAEARPVAGQHDGAGLADVHERRRELGDQRRVERRSASPDGPA